MKKIALLIVVVWLFLAWCTSKSSFSLPFDKFAIKFYDNNKTYVGVSWDTSTAGIITLAEMKEQTAAQDTWFINSLVIIKTTIQSWTDIKTLVESNAKKLQLKVLKYKATTNTKKKVKCNGIQYSWYITAFSYQLDKEVLYEWQYFFMDTTWLYLVALASDNAKDIKSFIKSIGTIRCSN